MVNDEWKAVMCPKVKLPGWWWKKHLAYYRNIKAVMDEILLKDWLNGGYEKHIERIKILIDQSFFEVFKHGFTSHYIKDGIYAEGARITLQQLGNACLCDKNNICQLHKK